MILTEKEARQRLSSPRNLLSSLDRGRQEPPVLLPSPYDREKKRNERASSAQEAPQADPDRESGEESSDSAAPLVEEEELEAPQSLISQLPELSEETRELLLDAQDVTPPTEEDDLDKAVLRRLFPTGYRGPIGLNDDTRAMIGASCSMMTERQAAQAFDVSQSTSHSNKHASTRTPEAAAGIQRPGLAEKIIVLQNKTRQVAYSKLLLALGVIDNEKILAIDSAKEASIVASNLSRVVTATTPKEGSSSQSVNFHVFVPQQASLSAYETIDVEPVEQVKETTD